MVGLFVLSLRLSHLVILIRFLFFFKTTNAFHQLIQPQRMPLPSLKHYSTLDPESFSIDSEAINRSLSGRLLCFARLFQSLAKGGSIPQSTAAPRSSAAQKRAASFRLLCPRLHTLAPCVRSGLCIRHSASFRFAPLRLCFYFARTSFSHLSVTLSLSKGYTPFQPYSVCHPPLFGGCSFAQPSALARAT